MNIVSSAFENGGMIPQKYTQEGENVSPPLSFSDIPAEAQSLALLCIDPDVPDPQAPVRDFTHWVIYNLPVNCSGLPEAVKISGVAGSGEGLNDRGKVGYIGPRPPIGTHRYYFKLYALNKTMEFDSPPSRAQVLEQMDGFVVGLAELMGRYKLKNPLPSK